MNRHRYFKEIHQCFESAGASGIPSSFMQAFDEKTIEVIRELVIIDRSHREATGMFHFPWNLKRLKEMQEKIDISETSIYRRIPKLKKLGIVIESQKPSKGRMRKHYRIDYKKLYDLVFKT